MDPNVKVDISEQIIAKEVGVELVILDLATGTYLGLDAVGTRIWQLLREGKDLVEVCSIMVDEFDVSRNECERDIANFLEELSTRNLINLA